MADGQAGKGSRRRKRDNRYCTAEQEAANYERALGKPSRFPQIAPEPTKAKRSSRVRTTVFDENGEPKPGPELVLDEKGLRIEP